MSLLWRIAAAQIDVTLGQIDQNLQKMADYLGRAAEGGVDLVVFPECALTGYCFESLEEALPYGEAIPGPSTARMAEECRTYSCYAVFGMLEREGDRLYNACVLVGPEGVVGTYRKVHLPYLGVDRFTTPGDRPFAVHQAGPARIGMHICYDGAFPEAARVMALEGADIVVLPTNWPPGAENTAAYVSNTRALENHIYFMAVDRVGKERGFRFIGSSKICDPTGKTLAEGGGEEEVVLKATVDVEYARNKRIVRVPGKHIIHRFHDRRPELYGEVTVARPRERTTAEEVVAGTLERS